MKGGADGDGVLRRGRGRDVYEGALPVKTDAARAWNELRPRTKTAIMLNLGNPEERSKLAVLPNDGVGLARMEFIISELHQGASDGAGRAPTRLPRSLAQRAIRELVRGQATPAGRQFFVEKLAEGSGMIAAAFYPKPVIVRLSPTSRPTNTHAARRRGLRAKGGKPDARLSGCRTLCAPRLCSGFRARMRGAPSRA